ncbi:MAG: S8 family serine peptidase [Microcoleaceae cyanobacterium]
MTTSSVNQIITRFDSNIQDFLQVQQFYRNSVPDSIPVITEQKAASFSEVPRTAKAISQGDTILSTDSVRATTGVDGSGIKIGIISDSFDTADIATNAADDVRTGDLPGPGNPNGYTTPVRILQDDDGGDEGRAMAQIIHDVAPGAEIFFHAVSTNVEMAGAIDALAQAGVDIIVDDIGFTNQPFFQDGVVAQAVDRVVEQGITYFTAAGNDGQRSYEAQFNPSGRTFEVDGVSYEAHAFEGNDVFNQFSLSPGAQFGPLTLQWNQPFASVNNSQGSRQDLDIFIVEDDSLGNFEGNVVASSTDSNIGDDPLETLWFTNNTDTSNLHLVIGKPVDSPDPDWLKYISFSSQARSFEYGHDSSTVFGHVNAEGAIAVAAVEFHRTPEYGTRRPQAKSSSSQGGTPIFLDANGDALQDPEVRSKPTLLAPDGVNTTFFGSDSSNDDDNLPNFYGTSAAAPHVAAVSALLLDAAGGSGSLTPIEIESILEVSALDANLPGVDFDSGSGLVQGNLAVELVAPQAVTNSDGLGSAADDVLVTPVGISATATQANGPVSVYGAAGNDALLGSNDLNQNDLLFGGRGDDTLMGRGGNDVLSGDRGEDILIGGAGGDRFDLLLNGATDFIKDYTLGEDTIGLVNLSIASLSLSTDTGATVLTVEGQSLAVLDGLFTLEELNFVELTV